MTGAKAAGVKLRVTLIGLGVVVIAATAVQLIEEPGLLVRIKVEHVEKL